MIISMARPRRAPASAPSRTIRIRRGSGQLDGRAPGHAAFRRLRTDPAPSASDEWTGCSAYRARRGLPAAASPPEPLRTTRPSSRRWPPEPFLEEVIEQVRQRWWNAMVVLAADDHNAIGRADDVGQFRQRTGSRACRVLLVHLVQQRQPVFERIHEADLMLACGDCAFRNRAYLAPCRSLRTDP